MIVAVPADLHESAGLVAVDRARARALELAARRASESAGRALEAGASGETAVELVRRWQDAGAVRVEIVEAVGHRRAAVILEAAAREVGLEVDRLRVAPSLESEPGFWPQYPDTAFVERLPRGGAALDPLAVGESDRLPSPLPPALHHGDPLVEADGTRWLDLLGAWVARCHPLRVAQWSALVRAHRSLVAPREAVYAGRSLRDRNAELLVNIL